MKQLMKRMLRFSKNTTRVTIAFVLMLASLTARLQNKAEGQIIDRVIAVVGKNIILQSELDAKYTQMVKSNEFVNADSKCFLLEDLLYQKILVAQAEKDSVDISDTQVEQELDDRLNYSISQYGTKESFEAFYGKTTEQFKDEIRDDVRNLLMAKNIQSKITGDLKVTPQEVKTYFNKIHPDSVPFINAEVEIGQILKKPAVSSQAKKEAKDRLEVIRQRILKGESFTSMAVLYSEDPGSATKGGEYKNLQRGTFVPEFEAVAYSLNKGDVSEIFETSFGYHFLQLMDKRGDIIDVRHILMSPKVDLVDLQKSKTVLDSVYALLKKDSISFAEAAVKYSDDEESKNSGGLIVNPQTGSTRFDMNEIGQFDPTIVFTIDKMKIGEYTKPALTQGRDSKQAYRIVYLKNRTEPHKANLKEDYQRIQQAALNEKQQKVIADWIKKKVNTIYLKIDDDFKSCHFRNKWVK